jgi:hypothetical protein
MRSILTFFLASIFIQVSAQREPSAFGEITPQDFASIAFDSTAASIVLFDKGRYVFDWVYPIVERHIRVKINKKEAFALWGDFKLGSDRFKSISKIKAGTYYLEGGKVISQIIEKDAILKDRKSNNQRIVSLSNLKEGCIIELSYQSMYSDPVIPSWLIQKEVPVLWSEYLFSGPADLTYLIRGGIKPFIYNNKYKDNGTFNRWVFKNIPAFSVEPMMPNPKQYFARIEFWLPKESWDKVNESYLKKHANLLEKSDTRFLKKEIGNLLTGISDSVDKVKALSKYIKDNYIWNGGLDLLADDLEIIYERKTGTSGDLNILLYTMLQFAGFKPEFVLISTRDNGPIIKTLPSENHFNDVLCKLTLKGEDYLLDVTDRFLPFNVPPIYCLNVEGFLISDKGYKWFKINQNVKEKLNVNARLELGENQMLTGKIVTAVQGYAAFDLRRQYAVAGDAEFKKDIPDNSWTIDSTSVTNVKQVELPFIRTYYASLPAFVTQSDDRIYVNPYILLKENENPWHNDTRTFPIDLNLMSEKTMIVNLTVPNQYKIETLPESQKLSLPDQSIACSFKVTHDEKSIVVVFHLSIQKTWFEPQEYQSLKNIYSIMISKQNEPIVLLRK